MVTLANGEAESMSSGMARDEAARNRARVLEIANWFSFEKAELDRLRADM